MNIWESIRSAFEALAGNKMRSSLTMLGIIIGVAAVIALSSLGEGVETMIGDQLQGLGSNILYIVPSQPEDSTEPVFLTLSDAEALQDKLSAPSIKDVAPNVQGGFAVSRGEESGVYTVSGVYPEAMGVSSLELAVGSFVVDRDLDERARVAVLGWDVYEDLFPDQEYPIGKNVVIEGTRYEVIGVLEAKGGMLGEDTSVAIPMTTAHSRLFPARTLSGEPIVSRVMASAVDEDSMDAAVEQIEDTLRIEHGIAEGEEDDFAVISQKDALETSSQVTGVLTTFLGVVAGISLLVGGIGIMNIMLVTVTERTREIGIRKAVGGTNGAVLTQFLVESLALSLIGGLMGLALGMLASNLASPLIGIEGVVTIQMIALATGISGAIGLVFGVYPAARAAQLNPIEALRHE